VRKKELVLILAILVLIMPLSAYAVVSSPLTLPYTIEVDGVKIEFRERVKDINPLDPGISANKEYWPLSNGESVVVGCPLNSSSIRLIHPVVGVFSGEGMQFIAYNGNTLATRVSLLKRDLPLDFSKKVVNISRPIDAWLTFPYKGNVTRGRYVGIGYYSYIDTDMSNNHWAKAEIDSLLSQGCLISTKASDFIDWPRQFEPDSSISVANALVWLVEAMPFEINSVPASQWNGDKEAYNKYFVKYGYQAAANDINIENSWAEYSYIALFSFIDASLKKEMLVPKADGNLGLEDKVTRAQFCQMVTKLMGWSENQESTKSFWDLKNSEWSAYLGAIGSCVDKGIMKGYDDGSFYPEGTMSRAEVACVIYELLGLGNAPDNPNTATPSHSGINLLLKVGDNVLVNNGTSVQMDTSPVIQNGRTLLPIRYIAEAIGAKVEWNQEEQKVTITTTRPLINLDKTVSTTTATKLEMWISQSRALVNGVARNIDENPMVTPLVIPPGRTVLPLRFVAETLGAQVEWLNESQEVVIIYHFPEDLVVKSLPPP